MLRQALSDLSEVTEHKERLFLDPNPTRQSYCTSFRRLRTQIYCSLQGNLSAGSHCSHLGGGDFGT